MTRRQPRSGLARSRSAPSRRATSNSPTNSSAPACARGHDADSIECISAAAVRHAQVHAHRGAVQAFHLSRDGEQIAVVQACAPMSEFSVREAQSQTAEQHLAQAQQTAHEQAQVMASAEPQAVSARAIA